MDENSEDYLVNAIEVERHEETIHEVLGSINASNEDAQFKEEEKLRQKLRFFYMNPIEKFNNKQRFPWKLVVQLIKIFLVTYQSYLFSNHRTVYVDFVFNNRIAFSHLFLQGWDPAREIISYPPQAGDLAIYKISEFYSAMDYAIIGYSNLDGAIGSYSYPQENNTMGPIQFCFSHFKICDIFGFNESYIFNSEVSSTCIDINLSKEAASNFSSEKFLQERNIKIQFSALVEANLSFLVQTVNLKSAGPKTPPDCYRFNLSIVFNNQAHDGKMKLALESTTIRLHCNGSIDYQNNSQLYSAWRSVFTSFVIISCLVSFVLCSRAVCKAQILRRKTVEIFRKYHAKEIPVKDQLDFVNWWYVTMICSDFIVIIGTGLKEKIEENEFSGDEWNTCSVMLGFGTFLIWFCVLRYFSFFRTYNVVVLTLKLAAPMIFRFMMCTLFIYAGFTFCGWLVLGPYHSKFRTLSITSECLFALINGDDVFGTFNTLSPTQSSLVWWFSRIYLYFFVSLFIYVILSLFVSVILDAYETIKHYYTEGFPKNDIQDFIDRGPHPSVLRGSSSSLADELPKCCPDTGIFSYLMNSVFCCKVTRGHRLDKSRGTEY